MKFVTSLIGSNLFYFGIFVCICLLCVYHGDVIVEKSLELGVKVATKAGNAIIIQPIKWSWANVKETLSMTWHLGKDVVQYVATTSTKRPEEENPDPMIHFPRPNTVTSPWTVPVVIESSEKADPETILSVPLMSPIVATTPGSTSPATTPVFTVDTKSMPIAQFMRVQFEALNDSRILVHSLRKTETEINHRLHVLKTDLARVSIHNNIRDQYDKFVRNYTDYSQLWRHATNKAEECKAEHEEYVEYLSSNIKPRKGETDEQYALRIVERAYDSMLQRHENIVQCFLEYERLYRAVLKRGNEFTDYCKTLRVDYDGIAKALQNGWTFGQIIKEYGLSFSLFYLPGTYFEILSVDGYGGLGAGAAGLFYKALKHLYEKRHRAPESVYQIQRIKGSINMVETMLMIHTRYVDLHLKTFVALKSRHGTLGQAILHLRPTGTTPKYFSTEGDITFNDFYTRYMMDIIRGLDSIRSKKKELEDYAMILYDLQDLIMNIELLNRRSGTSSLPQQQQQQPQRVA
jgi:hypothetical protein